MIVKLNKKDIIDSFLVPISRVSEECSITISSDNISTLINDGTETIILYCKQKTTTGLTLNETTTLNFKNIRKLIKVIECIQEDNFELKVGENASTISYKSPELSFKLHLVMDSVIKKCTASLDKISKLTFDSIIEVTSDKINEILKGNLVSDSDRVYFYTKDKTVYGELTNKTNQDVDSITFSISKQYSGNEITTPLPFNVEHLRLVNNNKFDKLLIKINNTYKILLFEILTPSTTYKYIVPGYAK